jgi:hypothetical protein
MSAPGRAWKTATQFFSTKRDEIVYLVITELRCANFFQCGALTRFVSASPYLLAYLNGGAIHWIGLIMDLKTIAVTTFIVASVPFTAYAQGTIRGAEEGAAAGDRAAGPVGAVVGGAVGAAVGTVGGILGVEERPRFREYVVREHRRSFRYDGDVRLGAVLPEQGVTLYAVPREYHVRPAYRYAVVNDRLVIVEPRSRRIVEIVE